MTNSFKPANYNSVSPYFIIQDAHKFIEFLKAVFDSKELRRYDNPDGSIMHAEFQIDDSVIMLGSSSEKFKPIELVMHVYVPNVDETFAKAIQAGCESIQEPGERE
ncbi:hypothetical protein L0U88_01420 [Flavihumibacter sp. RY-1]|uniref:Glyoxalase/fosfomycin resistance/dioxygenase domain-containing protein n=1 Tax=Flavihumibacter fluminis TaxID=2909236 RepID=A0ABS9BDV8_9BACT|nr:VOC family protein [Flavihumibacter fluminis]MCF1713284.1 hypothetical protein [Flavihumibacter fluminis]